jgi:nucleoside-diphosphate-sugar epimerase
VNILPSVLISGGTGFVGSWMKRMQPKSVTATYLSKKDYEVMNLGEYNYCVHLANIDPERMINISRANGARLLYCSSGIVYYPEKDTEYRRNKVKWEQQCLDSGVDIVIARLFTFFGEGLDDGKAWTQFTRAAQNNEPIEIWGDGRTVRSYMSGADMARWMWAILLHGESGEAYDVGSDFPVTMEQLASDIKHMNGSRSQIVYKNEYTDLIPEYLPKDTRKTWKLMYNEDYP